MCLGLANRLKRVPRVVAMILGACLCLSSVVYAQGNSAHTSEPEVEATQVQKSDDAVPPSTPAVHSPTTVPPHAFWDRTNLLLFSGIAATRTMDYFSTRNFQARGRQEILLPDDVVNNSAGFASLEAAATMTSVGIAYVFHRTGHHKLERWLSIGHIGVTAFGVIRNYSLESRHGTASR
jgi:hypothetical protein